MAARYDEEAVQKCFRLYLKYNGGQHERIEQEMRKVYPGWKRNYLYTRGKGANLRLGWIEKYSWEKGLAQHLAQKPTAVLNSAQQLVAEIEEIRKLLFERIKSQGANADKELIQAHRDYSRLSIEALTKVEAARDTLGAFVVFWEKLLDWMPDIDFKAARLLAKLSELIIAKAETEFGESESMVENLMNGSQTSTTEALPGAQA
jgi:hypothetical protein